MHRKHTGLSQRELARLLGYENKVSVSRHERLCALPPLFSALAYEVIFRVPVSDLFAGLTEAIEEIVGERLEELEKNLQQQTHGAARSRTLDWLAARRESLPSSTR